MNEFDGFAEQGWQCPICRRVYSPHTPMCWYCGNEETVTTTDFKIGFGSLKDISDGLRKSDEASQNLQKL